MAFDARSPGPAPAARASIGLVTHRFCGPIQGEADRVQNAECGVATSFGQAGCPNWAGTLPTTGWNEKGSAPGAPMPKLHETEAQIMGPGRRHDRSEANRTGPPVVSGGPSGAGQRCGELDRVGKDAGRPAGRRVRGDGNWIARQKEVPRSVRSPGGICLYLRPSVVSVCVDMAKQLVGAMKCDLLDPAGPRLSIVSRLGPASRTEPTL
jgi:hypothetical protein